MGNILGGGSNNNGGNGFSNLGFGLETSQCCDPVVDTISLLTTVGAIGAISAFLRQAVIDNNVMMRRRKKRSFENELDLILNTGTPSLIYF